MTAAMSNQIKDDEQESGYGGPCNICKGSTIPGYNWEMMRCEMLDFYGLAFKNQPDLGFDDEDEFCIRCANIIMDTSAPLMTPLQTGWFGLCDWCDERPYEFLVGDTPHSLDAEICAECAKNTELCKGLYISEA